MALEGTIKEFGLTDIFQLIGLQKKTGVLFLKGTDGTTVNVHFEDGMVVKTEDSQKRPKYLIGTIFINRGKITRAQLGEALDIQKNTLQKLGHILMGQGLVTKDELRDALAFQMSEVIFRVFRWKGGDYKFYQDKVDYDRDTIRPIGSEHILMDAVRTLDEWPMIEKKLPSHDTVLVRNPGAGEPEEDEKGGDIFGGEEEKGSGALSKDALHVFGLVDGKRSIYEIVELSRLGEFDSCKALLELLEKGYLLKAALTRTEPSIEEPVRAEQKKQARPVFHYANIAYAFLALSLLVIFVQITGTRRIMSPWETGIENLKFAFCTIQIETLKDNLNLYYLEYGSYPDRLSNLRKLDFVSSNSTIDPWGRFIVITPDVEGNTAVVSAGPDQTVNTPDDIKSNL